MTQLFGALTYLFTFAIFAIATHCAVAATHHKANVRGKHAETATGAGHKQASAKPKGAKSAHVTNDKPGKRKARKNGRADVARFQSRRPNRPRRRPEISAPSNRALEFVRKGKIGEATGVKNMLDDEAAQKLIEWFILRHPESRCELPTLRRVHR